MSALSIAGQQLKNFTSFSEHLTDIIIAIIVYISAFSLIIRNILSSKKTFTIKSTSFPFNLLKKEIETSEKEEE